MSSEREFLERISQLADEDCGYAYPVEDDGTDEGLELQAPGHRERETQAIHAAVPRHARRLIDFGCGVGRNFSVLDSVASGVLWGIDPDPARAQAARDRGRACKNLECSVSTGDASLLGELGIRPDADFVLCCQVIGHTNTTATPSIVGRLLDALARGGVLMLLYPFWNQRSGLADERSCEDDDFFHDVDTSLHPHAEGYRQEISRRDFDVATNDGQPGHLPVRAFGIEVSDPLEALPASVAPLPATLSSSIPSSVSHRSGIYSVHVKDAAGRPAIGDMFTILLNSPADGGA